jgi:hypothetical protein
MSFDITKNNRIETNNRRRITQRDIIPKAVKLRNSEIYQLGEETVIIYDKFRNEVIEVNQSDTAGKVEFGDNAWINYIDGSASFASFDSITELTATTINTTTLNATNITGLYTATEIWLAPIIPQWTDSWTTSSSYTDVTGSIFDVNFDDLTAGWNVYFDIVGKTDAGTGYWQLYNADDSAIITGSEITTTSTSPVNMRSGALTLPSGTKTLKVQHKIVGGNGSTQYVNSIMAKLVVRLSA